MGRPMVDILVPTIGRIDFLAETIDSVRRQTFRNWRLLISDNGSENPGEVRELVLDMLWPQRDEMIFYRRIRDRVSLPEHVTRFLVSCSAPYVTFLPDDDLWDETFLERRVRFLEANHRCAFVFSGMRVIDQHGGNRGLWTANLHPGVQDQCAFLDRLLAQNVVGFSSALIRRSMLLESGMRMSVDTPRVYDYEMWLRLASKFPVGFLPDCDAIMRVHDGQLSGDLNGLEAEYRQFVENVYPLTGSKPLRWKKRKLASMLLTGALNGIERGDSSAGMHYLARAVRIDPLSALDRRVPFAMLGTVGGKKIVAGARRVARNRGIGLR